MGRIRIHASGTHMGASILDIPAFPGDRFGLGFPEAIGDYERTYWFGMLQPTWRELDDGVWEQVARGDGELSYCVTLTPGEDMVEAKLQVTNESERDWAHSLAFNCFQCGTVSVRDNECLRHWCRTDGEFKRLVEVPRKFGPRPTIQLYSVEGAPRGEDIPFVANFQATPDVVLEGWLAIESRDGGRFAAAASDPAMFLFQNMEYSCIHSACGFGPLAPGETGYATTRLYFMEGTLEQLHQRIVGDMGR